MNLKKIFPFIIILVVGLVGSCKKDEVVGVRPTVLSTDAANNATNVAINNKISATFSVAMNSATITATTFTLQQGTTSVSGTVGSTGATATFTPSVNLALNTVYKATITTGAKDMAGTALATNYTWSFTTVAILDATLPTVISTDPANNAIGVVLNHLIITNFNGAMDPTTITSSTVTVKQGTTSVAGAVTASSTAATFTPTNNLDASKIYTVTITTGVKNIAGKALASNYTYSFTTGTTLDTTAPVVSSTDPLNNATAVALNKVLAITFSKAMNPSTISATTFTLKKGTSEVSGTITYTGTVASFTPSVALSGSTAYTATITTGAKDLAGNALAANTAWSFTTAGAPDVTAPTVSSTDPLGDATAVALNKVVSITFSEAMDPLTISATTFTLKLGTTAIAGTVAYTGTTATFTPSAALTAGIYTATLTTGAKDVAGNALAANKVWSFTTVPAPDTIVPTVSSTDPINSALAVPLNKLVKIIFSEAMDPLTISATTFTLKLGTTPVIGTVTFAGTTATFTPSTALVSGVYTATISTGAKDLAGNALAASTVWTFTTVTAGPDTTPPVANSTDPLNNATGVGPTNVVAITFSEAMDPLTINASTYTLKLGTTAVAGTVSYSGTTATFTPSNALAAGVYTATITTGAKDLAGNALAANVIVTFTVSGTVPTLAAVNLGSAINYVILAKSAVSNISISAITGDLGLSPAATSFYTGFALTNATGFATASQVTGKLFAADMAPPTPINLTTAVNDMITAYNDAAGRPTPDFLELATGNIGGKTLTPGLYKWTTNVTAPSSVVISGGPNDVWIFQTSGNLLVSNAVNITLSGGAQAKNIFWQVAGQATFGVNSHFEGIILCQTGINFQTGASFNGRALAQTAVTLDGNTIVKP